MEIGAFLSFRRKQLGFSLSDVGDALGYTPQAIYRYEKGNVKIDLTLVDSFCRILDLSLRSFFGMDPEAIEPYRGEKLVPQDFCSLLREELSKDPSLKAEVSSKLSVSLALLDKWENGISFPCVEEFLGLSRVMGYDPVDLYLGRPKKRIAPSKRMRKAVWGSVLGLTLLSACVLAPILISERGRSPSSSSESNNPILEKCSVLIQGYDREDFSPIASLCRRYQVDKGSSVPKLGMESDYYDYAYSELDGETFLYGSTPIVRDATIKAFFDKKTFKVTFLGHDGETPLKVSETRYLSSAIPPEAVADEGDFRFVSWKEDFSCVKSDLTVHSIFSRFRSNLVLDFENGEAAVNVSGYSADLYDSLPVPHKKGHEFQGYFDEGNVLFDKSYPLKGDTTRLHAVYKANTYRIRFEGRSLSQEAVYGESVDSLPDQTDENEIVLGWKDGDKTVVLPFVYEQDSDMTLTPILASERFDYSLNAGKVEIDRVLEWDGPAIDLSAIGPYPVSKIRSNALSGLRTPSIESIVLDQSTVELETACFSDLPSLKKAYFSHVDSSSVFHEGVFKGCPKLNYLLSGLPTKDGLSILKLKEYGIETGSELAFEFNEDTKEYPSSWNEGFGTLGALKLGNGIVGSPSVQSNGCQILSFFPAESEEHPGYSMITLDLPNIQQEELRFHGTSLVRIVGERFGTVSRFAMKDGGVMVSNRTKPLEVETFDISSGHLVALRSQTIKADTVLLSDRVSDGYFSPLNERLRVEFYGCNSIPSALLTNGAFTDSGNTDVSFHAEKKYLESEIVDLPSTWGEWCS